MTAQNWVKLNVATDNEMLSEVLTNVYGTGWSFGSADALADLNPNVGFDWDRWQAGNEAAAALLDPPAALQQMLANKNIILKGISDTSMDRIGSALALSLSQGLGATETAKAINYVINDPARALVIARTETGRALIQSNVTEYRGAGIKQIQWIASDPCKICALNANAIVPIGNAFPSGADYPPAHPNCICDVGPVSEFDENPISQGQVLDNGDYASKPDKNDLVSDKDFNDKRLAERGEKDASGVKTLASTYDRYGYHDKPLVSMSEFERLKEAGQPVTYRGVKDADTLKAAQIQERFKSGQIHYAGEGVHGNGTYSSTNLKTAIEYADGRPDEILEMVIRPEARIIGTRDLLKLREEAVQELARLREEALNAVADQMDAEGISSIGTFGRRTKEIREQFDAAVDALGIDESAFAVSRGYDIVDYNLANNLDEHYYIILNRSAVVVNG